MVFCRSVFKQQSSHVWYEMTFSPQNSTDYAAKLPKGQNPRIVKQQSPYIWYEMTDQLDISLLLRILVANNFLQNLISFQYF